MHVSIIIPVYNKIRYLATTLRQVQTQTFTDYECLLIDDGSTDGSGAVCDEFTSQDARFRVFHIPNGGVSHARNVGLDAAQGTYITFIDADDQIHEDYLSHLCLCAEKHSASFVIGNIKKVWRDSEKSENLAIPYQGLYPMKDLLPDFARVQQETGIYGFCVAKLIRRELVNYMRFNPEIRLAEDLDFYLALYPNISEIYFDSNPYYYYLQEAENSSMIGNDADVDYFTQLKIQLKITQFLEKYNSLIGDNETIMIRRLYDYVYFCLFYCPLREIHAMTQKIRRLELPERNKKEKTRLLKKTILFFFDKRCHIASIFVLACYRIAQSGKRWIRKMMKDGN